MREYGLKMCGLCGEVIPRERKLLMKLFFWRALYWDPLLWICYGYEARSKQKIILVGYIEDPGETGECLYCYSTVARLAPQCHTAKAP